MNETKDKNRKGDAVKKDADHDESATELSSEEHRQASEDTPKRAAVLHETIRLQGEDELGRTFAAL